MSFTLEKATVHDAAALEALARATFTATFGHLYAPDNLQAHLAKTCSADFFAEELSAGGNIEIARVGKELAGYIKYGAVGVPIEHHGNDREIHRLYVSAGHQGKGIGRALMDAALAHEEMRAVTNLFLGVWENNHKAQAFYGRYGFRPVSEYMYYVGTHADREIIMQRSA